LTGARARGRPETPSVARTTFLALTKQRSRTRRLCARARTVPCAGRCYSRDAACCGTGGGCHSSEPGFRADQFACTLHWMFSFLPLFSWTREMTKVRGSSKLNPGVYAPGIYKTYFKK
jgi:hypothetical protein